MGNIDSRSPVEDVKYANAMDLTHRLLQCVTMLEKSMLPHFGRDAFVLLDDFSQALVNQTDGEQNPFAFLMQFRYDGEFQNRETKKIYSRVLRRWSDRTAVEQEFGFLLAHYVEEGREWNTSVAQEQEILRQIQTWMDKNDAYTITSRSNAVPMPLDGNGGYFDAAKSTRFLEDLVFDVPDEPLTLLPSSFSAKAPRR